ncbi:hypothetical protein [Streptomyces blattellae]|uniref:hypothetical protein n=1 Tax=Streptomyces blattellae TaxID=2569855 RepID=UPI0012B6D0C4|nr:hypothetical protein [Streptomyces blattellae]
MSVLTYLLALPGGARVTLRTIAARRPEGRARIAAALRELEELRYLRRVVRGGAEVDQLPFVYEVFDTPYEVQSPTGETEKVRDRKVSERHTSLAAQLLISFGRIDSRLTLDATEALRLAPLVEEWWRRGASSAELRAAVVYGWPPQPVRSACALVEERLRDGCRPVAPTAAPVTAVEVEVPGSGAFAWRRVVRRGGELVRGLLKGRAVPA